MAKKAIVKCKRNFGAVVRSFVTDNASNVHKMRDILSQKQPDSDEMDVVSYGCSVHLLNLLSADVEVSGVKDEMISIAKYFRNKHLLSSWYRKAGGSKLTLPIDVRWNTVSDSIRSFLKNRGILVQVCQDKKDDIAPANC